MLREPWREGRMFETILRQIQASVRDGRYIMTVHADEEMNDDGLRTL